MEGDAKARLLAWQNPSFRICRVSRASGGKDRHSKVLTSKGLRDRRVRLSVSTAIQFYDLQDRLGYDQPSKAVDWLIKAASSAIAELPTLDGAFADLSRKLEAAAAEGKQNCETDDRLASRSKSACSSDSGNSKGSVLSLSRRDKAKERHASSDDRNDDSRSSFGDLLAGGDTAGLLNKQMRNVQPTATTATTTDYLTQGGLFGKPLKVSPHAGFPIQAHFPPGAAMGILPFNIAAVSGGDNAEIQPQFTFVQDHIIPVAQLAASGDYGLNFSISPGLAGLNRGTLQSNLQVPTSELHHIQRFSSQVEGPNVPFFFGAAPAASSAPTENHFMAGLDARLQLYHGGVYCSSDLKGKETN